MMKGPAGKAILRSDYAPYPWKVEGLKLKFDIHDSETRVRSVIQLKRRNGVTGECPIELDGQNMELRSIRMDGRGLATADYELTANRLIVRSPPEECTLEIENAIRPSENTALEGLYPSGQFLLTQCEAEGFRKITYFPDRPDVMTFYEVTIEADRSRYPVLLSNGNAVAGGDAENGRHWVRWDDPFRKPSYLFALVAGDLQYIEDTFTTRSGRQVTLKIYVEEENIDRCDHAMQSLKRAMKWDEDRFGLEYDLDIYNIVATNDFNMGAMENKSLNIFNARCVLASPEAATDLDFQNIEGVIGHEYFHNWTGNRVTCRDWFQLTLKEGLTVFRDQEFTSDMQSRAVKRIQDARDLRARQFPEDAGPMAHPIRPDRYVEINNFYTMTIYQKGAAIIRMVHTLLGEDGFQKGMKLYIERHDGEAVTCDDFIAAMADANDFDLEHFSRWYSQSGTPVVRVEAEYDEAAKEYTLHCAQHTPPTHDQGEKLPLTIPIKMGLLDAQGQPMDLDIPADDAPGDGRSRILILEKAHQSFTFSNIASRPVPSLLRGFSAPVKLEFEYGDEELALLMAHDSDTFVRWEAAQLLATRAIFEQRDRQSQGDEPQLPEALLDAFTFLLADHESDPALLGEALTLPAEEYLAELMDVVDVDGIHDAREFIHRALGQALFDEFLGRYRELDDGAPYANHPDAIARRLLKNACLSYVTTVQGGDEVADSQFERADNMTDALAAMRALVFSGSPRAEGVLAAFESRWRDDALVMDKWFAIQASRPSADTVDDLEGLMSHPAFSMTNPNKVRSVIGMFAAANPTGFHAAHGRGYQFVAEKVIELDRINPQVAARLVSAFNAWKRYDPDRREMMAKALRRVLGQSALSPDVSEIVTNALAQEGVS
ncbi:MAG: aminopeptidase N [Xanthomonadales bacterium]|nr:aminopeptidase N [Xanthomonadales bacterium]